MSSSVLERPASGGGGADALPPEGRGDGGGGAPLGADPTRFGVLLLLGTVTMLFIGFTSAYLVRRTAADWRPLSPPSLLWWNTAALVLSSVFLQQARRRLVGWDLSGAQRALSLTGVLGALFAAGQVLAWRQLAAQGVFLSSHPHSSFFYMLTGVHLLHVAAALIWYAVTFVKLRRMAYAPGEDGLSLFALFWHFLGVLWIYLLALLFLF